MLDDLVDSFASVQPRSRSDLLTELVTKSLDRLNRGETLADGPLTPEEIREVTRIVAESGRKGMVLKKPALKRAHRSAGNLSSDTSVECDAV